jgi:hypothetical protein
MAPQGGATVARTSNAGSGTTTADLLSAPHVITTLNLANDVHDNAHDLRGASGLADLVSWAIRFGREAPNVRLSRSPDVRSP